MWSFFMTFSSILPCKDQMQTSASSINIYFIPQKLSLILFWCIKDSRSWSMTTSMRIVLLVCAVSDWYYSLDHNNQWCYLKSNRQVIYKLAKRSEAAKISPYFLLAQPLYELRVGTVHWIQKTGGATEKTWDKQITEWIYKIYAHYQHQDSLIEFSQIEMSIPVQIRSIEVIFSPPTHLRRSIIVIC